MNQVYKIKAHSRAVFERKRLDWLWLSMLFLLSLNLFNKALYLMMGLLLIGLLITIYKKNYIKFTKDFFLIFLFCFSYLTIILFYKPVNISIILLYLIFPIGCFLIGYSIVKIDYKFIIKTFIVIALGNFTYGYFNMLKYLNINGIHSIARRVPDIWTGVEMSATIQGSYFTLVSSLLFYSIRVLKNKLLSVILIFTVIFSLYSSFVLGNRTLILLFIIIFGLNTILYSIFNNKNVKKLFKNFFLIVTFFILIWLVYSINLFGIKEFILNSGLYSRIQSTSILDDPRIIVYQKVFRQMFDYPLGGYKMNLGLSFAHNMWLDVLYATGLIPFIILILYTIKSIHNIISIIKNKQVDNQFKLFITSIYSAYFLNFMVEPILEGIPFMFFSFCLFNGMIRKYLEVCKLMLNKVSNDLE